MKIKQKKHKGITLIEVIIVVAIIGIISALGFELLGNARRDNNYKIACEMAASQINKTKNYSLTGKTVDGATPNKFKITMSGSTIVISGLTGGTETPLETVSLPGGTSFSGAFVEEYVVPYGGINNAMDVTFSDSSRYVDVSGFRALCR